MNRKPLKGLACVFLGIALPGLLFAQDSEFIPGDDRIIEKDILRRIQQELGQDIAQEKQPEGTEQKARETKEKASVGTEDATLQQVKLSLKDKRTVRGTVVLSQSTLSIVPKGDGRLVALPIAQIKSLEFTEWKVRRIQVSALPGARAKSETSAQPSDAAEDGADADRDAAEGADEGEAEAADGSAGGEDGQGQIRVYYLPTRCKIVRQDASELEGNCNPMDWLQFNLIDRASAERFRTYFYEDRAAPQGDPAEVQKEMEKLQAAPPVDTVISIELGGIMRASESGTAAREAP